MIAEVGTIQRGISFCVALFLMIISSAHALSVAGFDDPSAKHNWSTNLYFNRISDSFGLQLDFQQFSDENEWTSAKARMVSGSDIPDVLFKACLTDDEISALSQSGVLVDLSYYIEKYMPNLNTVLESNIDWKRAISSEDGSIYSLPLINDLHNQNAMWINVEWLKKLNVSVPQTADELLDVLRMFRDCDPNSNGKKDEIPLSFTGLWDLKYFSHAFGFIMDDFGFWKQGDTVHNMLTDSRNRDMLYWLNILWTEKLLYSEGFHSPDTYRVQSDKDSDSVYGMFFAPTPLSVIPIDKLNEYVLLEPLKDQSGERMYRDFIGSLTTGTLAITNKCKDIPSVLRWIDSMYSIEGMQLASIGQDGIEFESHSDGTWGWVATEEEAFEIVQPAATIMDGTAAPGWICADIQSNYENESTSRLVGEISTLSQIARPAMPILNFDSATAKRVQELQIQLGRNAEVEMIHFITGETELNDESWAKFVLTLQENGLQELGTLIQKVIR